MSVDEHGTRPRGDSVGPDAPRDGWIFAAGWLARALLTSAVVVLALRGYLFVDALIAAAGEESSDMGIGWGGSVGDVVVDGLPEVLIDAGILFGLGGLLLVAVHRSAAGRPSATRG